MTLATLTEAIDWVRPRWDNQRTASLRLHKRETEGIGLYYSPQFSYALDARVDAVQSVTGTQSCYHPLLGPGMSPRDCPECYGIGVKQVTADRYLWPMSMALTRLQNRLSSRRQPHPYGLVVVLASHGWDARQAARALDIHWDRAEALFLMALRNLHGYYKEGPYPRVSWVDKSDAQRQAETAA